MKLLLIRHAKAEDPSTWGPSARLKDAARRLTDDGRAEMKTAAQRLRDEIGAIDVLATSPFVRARETAEIVAQVFDCAGAVEVPALASGATPAGVQTWLDGQPIDATIALIGHQPDLSQLVGWFLRGHASVGFSPGDACLIAFDGPAAAATGKLVAKFSCQATSG
jgi:phosphohistidine phosphatase